MERLMERLIGHLGEATVAATAILLAAGCGGGDSRPSDDAGEPPRTQEESIDLRSYRLGSIGAFAEMVDARVKKLALSAPMTPEEMGALIGEAERIAGEHNVDTYLEADFLVTDLFSADLTEGKQVLFIWRGTTPQEYMEIKADKSRLEDSGQYHGEARGEIARRFGALLSYSDEKIEALIRDNESGL